MDEIVTKKKKEKGDTKKYLKKKWYLFLILFLTIFGGGLLGYISGPVQRDISTTYFIFCGIGLILLAVIDMLIILKVRFDMIKNKKIHKDLMFYFFFICLFLSGLILTIAFRILSLNDPNNILNKGNLISLLCSLSYLLLLALAVFFPLEKETKKVNKEGKDVTSDITNEVTTNEPITQINQNEINVVNREDIAPLEASSINNNEAITAPKKEEETQDNPPKRIIVKKIVKRQQPQGLTKQDIIDIIKNSGIEEAIRLEVRRQQKEERNSYIRPVVFNGQVFTSKEFTDFLNRQFNNN